jgi:hypothetical protein
MQQLRSTVLIVSLVIGLTACGGGKEPSTADVKADVAAQIAESGLDEAQSECFADIIVDDLGAATLKDVDFSADKPEANQNEKIAAAALKARSTCKIDAGSFGG